MIASLIFKSGLYGRRFSLYMLVCGFAFQALVSLGAPMSKKDAQRAVTGWLKLSNRPLKAKMAQDIQDVTEYRNDTGDVIYYVVSMKPEGYVVLSPDDLIEPIIAFSASGSYDPDPENPLYALINRDVPQRLNYVKALEAEAKLNQTDFAPPPGLATPQSKWRQFIDNVQPQEFTVDSDEPIATASQSTIDDVRVDVLVQSRWSQTTEGGQNCYNYYTPGNYYCGCVATALAQILRYHQHPTTGVGTASFSITVDDDGDAGPTPPQSQTATLRGGDGAGGPYDWANMVLDPTSSITLTERQAIGALTVDCGSTVNMAYATDGSGATTTKTADALRNTFMYGNAIKGYDGYSELVGNGFNEMANPNLDAGLPVIIGITGSAGGHAVVCDGYGYNTSTLYHHINMGWAGSSDAWYNLPGDLLPGFEKVHTCVYNIFVNGAGEIISGRVADPLGLPQSGLTVTADDGTTQYTDVTDSKGIYAIRVPSSTSFTLSCPGAETKNVITGISADYGSVGNLWGENFEIGGIFPSVVSNSLTAESFAPANGVLDPGEIVTIAFAVKNSGTESTTNLVATLAASGGVLNPSSPRTYGAIAAGAVVSDTFTFTVDGVCGGTVETHLQLQDGATDYGTFTNVYTIGVPPVTNSYACVTNINIPDASSVDVPIVINDSGSISNITVELRLNHTYDGDLIISLIHPDSTAVLLANKRGGSVDNYGTGNTDGTGNNTVFDDAASTSISTGSAPFAGPYQPEEPLSGLLGKSQQGTWYLRIQDTAGQDTGTIYYVAMNITTSGYTCASGSTNGTLSLASSSYSVSEDGENVTIDVTRTGGSDGDISVDIQTSDDTATAGVDYTGTSTTLTWLDGNSSTQSLVVPILDNSVYSGDRVFAVSLTNVIGGANLLTTSATVTILEDEVLPDDPTGLVATPSVGQVALRWDAASEATGYHVKRSSTQGGDYTNVFGVVTTNYTDSSVIDGSIYYYVVSATNPAGESADSGEVGATLLHTVPFTETFDGAGMASALTNLVGQRLWAGSNAVVEAGVGVSGTQGLNLGAGTAEQTFTNGTNTVSVSVWCKPVPGEEPSGVSPDSAAVFWVDTNLSVRAYSNTTAVTLPAQINTNNYTHFEVGIDYGAGTWQISVDGTNAASGLGVYSNRPHFTTIRFENTTEKPFYIDDISIASATATPTAYEIWLMGYGFTTADSDSLSSNGVNTIHDAYIAGLDPRNPASRFEITDIGVQSGKFVLQWPGETGRLYNVYWATNLMNGFILWQSNVPWNATSITNTDHASENQGFYRIDVQLDE